MATPDVGGFGVRGAGQGRTCGAGTGRDRERHAGSTRRDRVSERVLDRDLRLGGPGHPARAPAGLNRVSELGGGPGGDVECAARRACQAGARDRELVASAGLVDRQVSERGDPVGRGRGQRSGQCSTAGVRCYRDANRGAARGHSVAVRVLNRDHDGGADRRPRNDGGGLLGVDNLGCWPGDDRERVAHRGAQAGRGCGEGVARTGFVDLATGEGGDPGDGGLGIGGAGQDRACSSRCSR